LGRRVKCQVTQEYGDSDEFVKIDGKYYKSQEIYDNDRKQKDLWNKIIKLVCEDLLGYDQCKVFPSLVIVKLKELKFYDREVIYETFMSQKDDILYWINQDGKFKDDAGKISYMFAIIKGHINEVDRQLKRDKTKLENTNKPIQIVSDMEIQQSMSVGKDISKWLEEDEL
jgi:hypothetical protein